MHIKFKLMSLFSRLHDFHSRMRLSCFCCDGLTRNMDLIKKSSSPFRKASFSSLGSQLKRRCAFMGVPWGKAFGPDQD